MPIAQERIRRPVLPHRRQREARSQSVEEDEVVYHSVFPGSAGLMVRTPDKRLALARFANEAQVEVERPLHRPNGART